MDISKNIFGFQPQSRSNLPESAAAKPGTSPAPPGYIQPSPISTGHPTPPVTDGIQPKPPSFGPFPLPPGSGPYPVTPSYCPPDGGTQPIPPKPIIGINNRSLKLTGENFTTHLLPDLKNTHWDIGGTGGSIARVDFKDEQTSSPANFTLSAEGNSIIHVVATQHNDQCEIGFVSNGNVGAHLGKGDDSAKVDCNKLGDNASVFLEGGAGYDLATLKNLTLDWIPMMEQGRLIFKHPDKNSYITLANFEKLTTPWGSFDISSPEKIQEYIQNNTPDPTAGPH